MHACEHTLYIVYKGASLHVHGPYMHMEFLSLSNTGKSSRLCMGCRLCQNIHEKMFVLFSKCMHGGIYKLVNEWGCL